MRWKDLHQNMIWEMWSTRSIWLTFKELMIKSPISSRRKISPLPSNLIIPLVPTSSMTNIPLIPPIKSCIPNPFLMKETSHPTIIRIQEHCVELKDNSCNSLALSGHYYKIKHHICMENARTLVKVDQYYHNNWNRETP